MDIKDIAKKLVDYCRKGDWDGAQNELYHQDVSSTEPYATEAFEKEVQGLKAVKEKGKKFKEMTEAIHSLEVSEPLIAGESIAFILTIDMTMKGMGRMNAPELCVYRVKDGKIISEEFFV